MIVFPARYIHGNAGNSSFLVTFHEYIPCGIHAWKLQLSRDISGICFLQDTHIEMQETPAFLLISWIYFGIHAWKCRKLQVFYNISWKGMLPIPMYPSTRNCSISLKFSFSGYLSELWSLKLISLAFSNQENKLLFLWNAMNNILTKWRIALSINIGVLENHWRMVWVLRPR